MRKIQPGALQAAKQHHMDETIAWMQALSLSDTESAPAEPTAALLTSPYALAGVKLPLLHAEAAIHRKTSLDGSRATAHNHGAL